MRNEKGVGKTKQNISLVILQVFERQYCFYRSLFVSVSVSLCILSASPSCSLCMSLSLSVYACVPAEPGDVEVPRQESGDSLRCASVWKKIAGCESGSARRPPCSTLSTIPPALHKHMKLHTSCTHIYKHFNAHAHIAARMHATDGTLAANVRNEDTGTPIYTCIYIHLH